MKGTSDDTELQKGTTAFRPWEPFASSKPLEQPSSFADVSADTAHAAELLTQLARGTLPAAAAWQHSGEKQRYGESLDADATARGLSERQQIGAINAFEVPFG